MQKLILIAGEAWTGKTTCAELLYRKFENSAWLDGDSVWKVNPFSVADPRLRNSDLSMAFVLDNYLKSGFDYVFFSSIVLSHRETREGILKLITTNNFEVKSFTLTASERVLKERAGRRDGNADPQFYLLEESLKQDSIFVDTSNKTPEEAVNIIVSILGEEPRKARVILDE